LRRNAAKCRRDRVRYREKRSDQRSRPIGVNNFEIITSLALLHVADRARPLRPADVRDARATRQ